MDFLEVVLILGVGLVAGAVNTLAGGGSLLSLPILIFLGLPPAVANATNRVAIFANFVIMGFVEAELKKNRPSELNMERF